MNGFYIMRAGEVIMPINNLRDLDRALDDLAAKALKGGPLIVEMISPLEDRLLIGIVQSSAFLSFEQASGNPPYMITVGSAEKSGTVKFDFEGELTEIPRRYCIPLNSARQAIREYFQTGELSKALDWEEV